MQQVEYKTLVRLLPHLSDSVFTNIEVYFNGKLTQRIKNAKFDIQRFELESSVSFGGKCDIGPGFFKVHSVDVCDITIFHNGIQFGFYSL